MYLAPESVWCVVRIDRKGSQSLGNHRRTGRTLDTLISWVCFSLGSYFVLVN